MRTHRFSAAAPPRAPRLNRETSPLSGKGIRRRGGAPGPAAWARGSAFPSKQCLQTRAERSAVGAGRSRTGTNRKQEPCHGPGAQLTRIKHRPELLRTKSERHMKYTCGGAILYGCSGENPWGPLREGGEPCRVSGSAQSSCRGQLGTLDTYHTYT